MTGMIKMERNWVIVLEQNLVKSRAFLSLNGTEKSIFFLFRCKCVYERYQGKKHCKRKPQLVNNGEIVFTYAEALEKYGISQSSFKRAIDGLIDKGFLDIAATGCGTFKSTTFYAISERWRKYGTPDFVKWKRPKRNAGYPGFKKGNTHWEKKMSTIKNDCSATVKNDSSYLIAMRTNDCGEKIKRIYKFNGYNWIDVKIA